MNAEADIPARYAEEIALRAYDDRYIDRDEEREILQIALQLGVRSDRARSELAKVCERDGYVLETAVIRTAGKLIELAGHVDEATFADMVRSIRPMVPASRTDRQVKALLVQALEERTPPPVKVGWFRDWYRALKRDLGMA